MCQYQDTEEKHYKLESGFDLYMSMEDTYLIWGLAGKSHFNRVTGKIEITIFKTENTISLPPFTIILKARTERKLREESRNFIYPISMLSICFNKTV